METLQTNEIEFSDGLKAVPLWMLDYLSMFWELEGDFSSISYDQFVNIISGRIQNNVINDLLIEKHGYNPLNELKNRRK